MNLSKTEARQLLERLIFDDTRPEDWVQDVWGLSPTLGESAAKLLEVFQAVVERCPDDELETFLETVYEEQFE